MSGPLCMTSQEWDIWRRPVWRPADEGRARLEGFTVVTVAVVKFVERGSWAVTLIVRSKAA